MIDTIILEIPIKLMMVYDMAKFRPNARQLEGYKGYGSCKNNPTAEDYKKGIYKPKLTLIKRGEMIILKVEFSAPKVLFQNNLDEIEENDFQALVLRLYELIKEMGVLLTVPQIENAKVIGLHPSKNVVLKNGYTAQFALKELKKINLSKKMDLSEIKFRNEGEEIQFYSNSHSVVFYDKINDLTKANKRATDKDQTSQQRGLFDLIKQEKKTLEILRMEIRLAKSANIKEVLQEVGFNQAITLKNIFKKDLCQKIVKLYWEKLFGNNLFLFNTYNNPQKILEMILIKYPKTKIGIAVKLVGLALLCKDEDGFRGFRKIVEGFRAKKDWIALKRYLDKLSDGFFEKPMHGFIVDIQEAINKFEAYKIKKEDKVYPLAL